ncbi:arginase family protein [Sphingomicrobium nitratireducens]|uniref:arginase family protein n=1 Tax=Sphingomicrobium nitratireducens TaxID=2964666 RepID=UPI00223FB915|nr:arginase family protein [Sphingomicrobium nitratireducens]
MSWPNLNDLIVSPTDDAPIGLVGAPLSAGSVTPGRCDLAPAALRKVLPRIGRYDIDESVELSSRIADHGDVAIAGLTIEEATDPIRGAVETCVAKHDLTLLVGGNNAVTRPGLHALGLPLEKIGLITLDAHFDMRETGMGLRNGNPVRALLEDGLPGKNIAQVGLAPFANSQAMHADALAAGNRVVTLADINAHGIDQAVSIALAHVAHCEAVMIDCDIDVIDRSQFPGAPGARPAGMQAADFFRAARLLAAEPRVKLIDLTEWDPPLDATDLSSLVAGRWLAEILSGFEAR